MRAVIILFGILLATPSMAQTKIGGIMMPNKMKIAEGEYLTLNGGGIREKYWIDLYVGVLYLQNKSSSAKQIMEADEPMAVKLRVISGMVSNSKLEDAVREGMEKSTGGNMAPYQDRLDQLISEGFSDDVIDGDVFDLIYRPSRGTTLVKNNKELVTVKGLDFKSALFGVWLCDDPADENLKEKMLGN